MNRQVGYQDRQVHVGCAMARLTRVGEGSFCWFDAAYCLDAVEILPAGSTKSDLGGLVMWQDTSIIWRD